jgi:hypothetical protein
MDVCFLVAKICEIWVTSIYLYEKERKKERKKERQINDLYQIIIGK